METLYQDLIKLLIENYFHARDSLALLCVSKKFAAVGEIYRGILLDAKTGLEYCITNGNLAACQLINKTEIIDIHADNEWAFRLSCSCGHLEIMRWLYQLSTKHDSYPINIHVEDEWAFCASCSDNLINAQWLYQLSIEMNSPIDIHINDETPFCQSCQEGHLEIARWLYLVAKGAG